MVTRAHVTYVSVGIVATRGTIHARSVLLNYQTLVSITHHSLMKSMT
jgi:hypothetical protein